jgi:hypothetical protein
MAMKINGELRTVPKRYMLKLNVPYEININSTVQPLSIGLTLKKAVSLYPPSIGFLH